MAEPLKRFFDAPLIRRIADSFAHVDPAFPRERFVAEATSGLDRLELLDRARHVAAALSRALPADVAQALERIVASLGPELDRTEGFGMAPFFYLPHVIYVADHGLRAYEIAMHAQHELTRRFSAEFSIRPFLEREPERTVAWLRRWARDPSAHVRRLVSEGTRPRLPWAPRLRRFQEDPGPVLELLELLKDDPSRYVRRSVANNLNDIGKDHPDLLVETCARWSDGATPERAWIVRHALRSAVKRGDPRALAVLGYHDEGASSLRVAARFAPARPRLGEDVEVTLEVENAGHAPRRVVVDLAVHFVKADGAARPKVFKVRALTLAGGERCSLRKRISFADLTTRRHHAGRHRIDVLLNGRAVHVGDVDVRR